VLSGPGTRRELRENLAAVERGPLDTEELAWMRSLGQAAHGRAAAQAASVGSQAVR